MDASLEFRHLFRMQKRLDKAYNLMVKARQQHQRLSGEQVRSAYRRRKRDQSYRETDARRARSAEIRRKQAHDHYKRCQGKYEEYKASYYDMTRELRQKMRPTARQVGIPQRYLDDFHVVLKKDGEIHFYFGGDGHPLGDGHAHVVVNPDGSLKYLRNPKQPLHSDSAAAYIA